jgi:hypothetical protein
VDLLDRVARRGGSVRVVGERVQYRPAGVLADAELTWLLDHQSEVVAALADSGPQDPAIDLVLATPPLGEAGPGIKAWRCFVAISSIHKRGARRDGSTYCATCHPPDLLAGLA